MEMISVQSTDLAAVGYDADTLTLVVDFVKGGRYQYSGVPAEVHEGLMNAPSKGTYFNQNIRKAGYSYIRLS